MLGKYSILVNIQYSIIVCFVYTIENKHNREYVIYFDDFVGNNNN